MLLIVGLVGLGVLGMTEPIVIAEASRHIAECRAGVYDDTPDTCTTCDRWPCACDDLHDRDVEGWGE